MNKTSGSAAFTMIEIIVVISIISILLLFSFPMISKISIFGSDTGASGDIAQLSRSLKKKAVADQTDYLLHLDRFSQSFWVTHEGMADTALETARSNASKVSSGSSIVDVRFADTGRTTENEYIIRFSKEGYSDYALIHMVEDEHRRTIRIDAFLSECRVVDDHVDLQECI